MDEQLLNRFYNDEHTRENVLQFLYAFIDAEAVRRVYAKEDVSAVADARTLIELAFSSMQDLYGIRPQTPKPYSQAK